MKSFKISKNGEHVATAAMESLDGLEASVMYAADRGRFLRIHGHKITEVGVSNYLWADDPLSLGDVVTVEFVEATAEDKPNWESHGFDTGPLCLFCGKPHSEVGEIFPMGPRTSGICQSCVLSFASQIKK